MSLIKHTIEIGSSFAGNGGLYCQFKLGDWEDIVNTGSPEAQEELLIYLARVLVADMYDSAFFGLADDCCEQPYNPEHLVQVSPWHHWSELDHRGSFVATKALFTPDILENVFSYMAYHHTDDRPSLRDIYGLCIPKPTDDSEALIKKEYWYQNMLRHKNIVPPDMMLPHDLASNSIVICKTFYLYRTKTSADRFNDKDYCRKLSKDLADLFRLVKAKLYHDHAFMFPYYDTYIRDYRPACMFPQLKCSDTFAYASADCEPIPASEFDWIISYLEEANWCSDMVAAICSWLRSGQLPLPRYKTKEYDIFFEKICDARGKPWEIIDVHSLTT